MIHSAARCSASQCAPVLRSALNRFAFSYKYGGSSRFEDWAESVTETVYNGTPYDAVSSGNVDDKRKQYVKDMAAQ